MAFSKDALRVDAKTEANRISNWLREQVLGKLKRKGVVVGLSGGVDSSVVCALAVRAFGKDKVCALFMPERASSSDSLTLGRLVAKTFGLEGITAELHSALEGLGCYRAQDEAVRSVFPGYQPGWKFKLVLPSILQSDRLNVFHLTVQKTDGTTQTERLPLDAYLKLVAATNYKQRARKMTEYFHADRLHYAVAGTPNKLEYDQGFFVKQGDGAADVKPIAHLYKTQVYALAKELGVPEDVTAKPPTTDTYSMPQTQEEFYFALPYNLMDLCLYALEHQVPAAECAASAGLKTEQVERVYKDIESKRRYAAYLHAGPALLGASI
jgi:NAD+ synthase